MVLYAYFFLFLIVCLQHWINRLKMFKNFGKYVFSVLLIFNTIGFSISAQNNSKSQQQFQKALQHYNLQEYGNAISEIEKLRKKDPGYVDAILLLSDIYHDSGVAPKEIETLETALQYSQNALIYYRLGKANYSVGDYEKALANFEKYLQKLGVSDARKNEINRNIMSCRFAIDAIKSPVDFNPSPLSGNINTADDEYWPSISLDGEKLVFTRRQRQPQGRVQEDFYISEIDSVDWCKASPIDEINTSGNEGAQSLSADGRLLFFTACNRADGLGSCDIYYSVFNGIKWGLPKNAGSINGSSWDAQPTISSDNRFLYFSSNRSGGKGKKDIWCIELLEIMENGNLRWDTAQNLGAPVNTEGDEISPFVHPNNKDFYFASDHHIGMGGLDLFHSEISLGRAFTVPENLGFPINTFKDEQGLMIGFDGTTAYFASERNGTSGLDIFSFQLPEDLRPDPVSYVKAKITDAETGVAIAATVDLVNFSADAIVKRVEKADENGEILLCLPLNANYAFNVSQTGYLFYSQAIHLEGLRSLQNPFFVNIQLEPVKIGAEMNLYNIYFETDSFSILPQSFPELNKLVSFIKNNPDLEIEIQGHTDNTGSEGTNLVLSGLRAQSVVDYLVSKGIQAKKLKAQGYGESVPVAPNDNDEGRKLNRRTTIKIEKF
jgi:outer membrane protein OmpA-like peptidoglycan-associated protein/tetratricopeptide (TPR) repeat protein